MDAASVALAYRRSVFRPLTRLQIVADTTIASVFGLTMMLFTLPMAMSVGMIDTPIKVLSALLLTLVFSIVLGLRRYAPGLALGVAWIAAIVQMLSQLPPLPANLAILGVLYTCAAYGSTRLFWIAFGSSIAGALAITVYLLIPSLTNVFISPGETLAGYVFAGGALFLSSVLGLMLSWTVGALVRVGVTARASAEARRRAEERAASEFERNRIARDMHDVVAHSLAVVIAQADGARYAVAASPDAATDALQTISTTARSALSDVRMLLTQLRHSQAAGPQPTVADLEALYAQVRAAGVELRVDVDPVPPGEPPAAVQLAVYRILQEALTNALRHGGAGGVDVSLAWLADRVELRVRNAVTDADPAPPSGGHGLIGMRERAQLIGGRLDAGAAAGVFTVSATLPIGVAA